jgi:hypothetical protein
MAWRSSSRAWRPSRHARLGPQAGYPEDDALERPVHSAEQPADPKRYYRRRIGLGFDGPAKPLVKGSSGVARGVGSLAVEVLGSPRRLIELSLYLRSGVACQASHALFDLAADVSGCARYAVFIHGTDPSRHGIH